MKNLTIELSDELYDRAQRRAAERGISLPEEVVAMVEQYSRSGNGDGIVAARVRMQELFDTVRGFPETIKIPREKLHERGCLH